MTVRLPGVSDTTDHFDELAPRYAALRATPDYDDPVTEAVAALGALDGARVLDVGCGPGTVLERLARERDVEPAGIDVSPAMLEEAQRRLPDADLRLGRAESLPFADGSFDVALMRMVVHLLDRPAAFREVVRVVGPEGRLVITTSEPSAIADHWTVEYFPSVAVVDGARFPSGEQLCGELVAAGFATAKAVPLGIRRRFDRAEALDKLRGRAYSTLSLLPEGEYERGLALAERTMPDEIAFDVRMLNVVASRRRGR